MTICNHSKFKKTCTYFIIELKTIVRVTIDSTPVYWIHSETLILLIERLRVDSNEFWKFKYYVEIENAKFEQLDGLDRNVIPILRQSMSVHVSRRKGKKSFVIGRRQVPCSPSFAITHYRAQGRTFQKVILDLEVDRGGMTGHQNFAATYVMLSRGTGLSGVSFLRWFRYDLLKCKPGEQY